MRRFALPMALLAACGCASAAASPNACPAPVVASTARRASGAQGGTALTITFADHLGFPYRLSELQVELDGEVLCSEVFEPGRVDRPCNLARLQVPTGVHTLQVVAVASYASTRLDADEGCRVTIRAARSPTLLDQPARLHVDLYTRGVTKRFSERLAMRIEAHGTDPSDEGCAAPPQTIVDHGSPVCDEDAPLIPVDDRQLFDFEDRWQYPF